MKNPKENTPYTLTDADIISRRNVSRRGLLGALGITVGVAASVVLGTRTSAQQSKSDQDAGDKAERNYRDNDRGDRVMQYRDNDRGDRAGTRGAPSPKPVPGGLPGAKPTPDDPGKKEP